MMGRRPSGGDQEVILHISKKLGWFASEIIVLDKKFYSLALIPITFLLIFKAQDSFHDLPNLPSPIYLSFY